MRVLRVLIITSWLLVAFFCGESESYAQRNNEAFINKNFLGKTKGETSFTAADERIEEAFEKVLSQSEFDRLVHGSDSASSSGGDGDTWWERFLQWLNDLFESDEQTTRGGGNVGSGVSESFLPALGYGFIFVIIALILFFVAKAIIGSIENRSREEVLFDPDSEEVFEIDSRPGDHPPEKYLAEARRYATEGNFKIAIRLVLLASLSFIEYGGYIHWRKGLTNRDYLRAIWREKTLKGAFIEISKHFDEVYFGKRTADQNRFLECMDFFKTGFQSSPGGGHDEVAR